MNKPNIALVMGGYSGEHDISIQSGCQVYEALDHQKYNVYKIVIDRQGWYCLADNDQHIPVNRHDFTVPGVDRFNLAFIIIHGNPGENGVLQGYFDMLGIPYTTCGYYTSALTFHKGYCNPVVKSFGIVNVARSVLLYDMSKPSLDKIDDAALGYPLFVKPAAGGSSVSCCRPFSRLSPKTAKCSSKNASPAANSTAAFSAPKPTNTSSPSPKSSPSATTNSSTTKPNTKASATR